MYSIRHFIVAIMLTMLGSSIFAQCTNQFPQNDIIFQAEMHYRFSEAKTHPYIEVLIQGQAKRFLLDTGANIHTTWDTAFLPVVGSKTRQTEAIHSTQEEVITELVIADSRGRSFKQEVCYMKHWGPKFSERGINGVLSPQRLANNYPFLIDFQQGCFTVLRQIDLAQFHDYQIYRGRIHPNPYQVMMIPIDLGDKEVRMTIDSGAKRTSIVAQAIQHFPLNHQRLPESSTDLFGKSAEKMEPFRVVDFVINGIPFKQYSVRENSKRIDAGEFIILGRVGMDVIKDFIILADFSQNTFHLLQKNTKNSFSSL